MKKEELRNIMYLDNMIESKLRQLKYLKSTRLDVGAIDYSKDKIQNNNVVSVVEEALIKIIDLEDEINDDIVRLVDLKQRVRKEVNQLPTLLATIIEMRYFEKLEWEEIAYRLSYSIQHIYRLHGQALKELNHERN